jgi:hypothetical protein
MQHFALRLGCGAFRVGECRLQWRELAQYVTLGHFAREHEPLLVGQTPIRRLHASGLEDQALLRHPDASALVFEWGGRNGSVKTGFVPGSMAAAVAQRWACEKLCVLTRGTAGQPSVQPASLCAHRVQAAGPQAAQAAQAAQADSLAVRANGRVVPANALVVILRARLARGDARWDAHPPGG